MSREPVVSPDDPTPRVLGVRFGVNPNSSSLGVDVTFLLFGGAFAAAVGIGLSALLRGRSWTHRVEPIGPLPSAAPEPRE